MADLTLTDSEQKYLLSNPHALAILMDYHDLQQDQADSMEAGCFGDELRREELRQHGAKIIAADPDIWTEDVRKQFAEPTGRAAQRLARAVAIADGVEATHAPMRDVPPGKWKVDMPDGTYGRMPGDPPGPASVTAVIGGYVYDVEPRTGKLIACEPPTGYRLQKFNEEMQQRADGVDVPLKEQRG